MCAWVTFVFPLFYNNVQWRKNHAADTCDGSLYHEHDESYDFREGSPRTDDFHACITNGL
jgi:hypothetical protein